MPDFYLVNSFNIRVKSVNNYSVRLTRMLHMAINKFICKNIQDLLIYINDSVGRLFTKGQIE